MHNHPLVIGLLALLPPLLSWRWHRGLRRAADHALVTERVAAVNQRVAAITGVCAVLVVAAGRWNALWALALLFTGVAAAAYPTRRILFGETWPFRRYLEWRVRIVCACFGLFLLLAASPAMLLAVAPHVRGWVAAALLIALVAWHHWYPRVLLFMVSAVPLRRADLEAAFERVLARSTAAPPALWHAGAEGGVIANALAMPGLFAGRVLFFDTLLERLTPAETAAIFAHEVAHLEYFTPKRVRQGYAAMIVGIALTVGVGMAAAAWSAVSGWFASVWPICVLAALAARAGRMQANETASDVRACVLCGDPEALVSALTKLHAIHHVPRRWSSQLEQHASHPSLARRIRAIRAATQHTDVQRLARPVIVRSTESGRAAVFEAARLTFTWTDPDAVAADADPRPAARRLEAMAYEELVELRLTAAAEGAALLARARSGASWTLPLQPGDLAAAQAALDVVDQLVAPSSAPAVAGTSGRRLAAALVLMMAVALSSVSAVLMPALLALLRPTRPAVAALATALVAAAFLANDDSAFGALRALVFALLGAMALWQARRMAQDDRSAPPRMPSWVEGLWLSLPLAAGAVWIVAGNQHHLFGLHVTARDAAWLAASAAALTGYLAVSSVRRYRRLSVGAAALAVAVLWLGSSSFLTAVVRDPLAADMPFLSMRTRGLTQIAEASVTGHFARIRVTNDGRYFLLSEYEIQDDPEDDEPQRHVVGAFDGRARAFQSAEAAFADDQRLLIVDHDEGATRLRVEDVRSGSSGWETTLPGVEAWSLRTGSGGRWEVMHRDRGGFTRLGGRIGTAAVDRTTWSVETTPEEYVVQHLDDGSGGALAVASDWQGPRLPWLTLGWRSKVSLLRLDAQGTFRVATSDLTVRCAESAIGAGPALCVSFDGRRSRFWEYVPGRPGFQAHGQMRGMVFSLAHDAGRAFAATLRSGPALVNLDAGEIVTFEGLPGRFGTDIATAAGFVARARMDGDRTVVSLHRTAAPVSTP